jgi:phosphoribosylamine-glycine ligase
MKSDLYATIMEAVSGDLSAAIPSWHQDRAAVGVVMASGGYPGSYEKGYPINGTEKFKVTIVALASNHLMKRFLNVPT